IRRHSLAVAEAVARGEANDLLERLSSDAAFKSVQKGALMAELDPARYVGRSPEQVTEFLGEYLEPLVADARRRHPLPAATGSAELRV
ncbi:MAG: hypothetical protein ABUL71_00770, partial [Gemmatimonadota bacterium]